MQRLDNLHAPAKLNLFLHLVGKRDDGYHLVHSAMVLLDWHDTLHFELRAQRALSREDIGEPLPPDDLCMRAARALQAASGTSMGAHIQIKKSIPSCAGLGGGSSDAATTLIALNRLWNLNWPRKALQTLGLSLGADVPFFVGGRSAWVHGIGEKVHPVQLAPHTFVVIKPAAGASTQQVFGSQPLSIRPQTDTLLGLFDQQLVHGEAHPLRREFCRQVEQGWGHNDLQLAAQAVCPDITLALKLLHDRFGNSRLSGSGSAVFARSGVNSSCTVRSDLQWLDALPLGWLGKECVSLNTHPLCDWVAD